jgi:N-acetyl sugar amidotransferase
MSEIPGRICRQCIMDESDPEIVFDQIGTGNHCHTYAQKIAQLPKSIFGNDASQALEKVVEAIKNAGRNKPYDCLIGVSGGVDSTYVAYLTKKLGLRPLAVHFDNGWDSELAVLNVSNICKKLEIDLYSYVVDWEEFRDLQLSFFRSSLSNPEIPTDHGITASLYRVAAQHDISCIIVGVNMATEAIMPMSWTYHSLDYKLIKNVQKIFGTKTLKSFPKYSLFDVAKYSFVKKIKRLRILDYIHFDRNEVMEIIKKELDWKPYGAKHHESHYTRFCQQYVFPRKFGFDKRRAHLSSLICAGQMTRAQALQEFAENSYTEIQMEEDRRYVAKKFNISLEEFDRIMAMPIKYWWEYPNNFWLVGKLIRFPNLIKMIRGDLKPKLGTNSSPKRKKWLEFGL